MNENDNLKNLFNKLVKTIETQASFTFGNKRIVDKQRIDDILCNIDIEFPEILRRYRNKHGNTDKNIQSFKTYEKLIANIKIKPLFGKNSYSINYKEVVQLVATIGSNFAHDIKYLEEFYPELK